MILYVSSHVSTGSYAELVSLVYEYYAVSHKIDYVQWGDKNNFYIDYIPQIIELFPNARFIHIVRDGRDVGCSYLELSKKSIDSKYKPVLPTEIKNIADEWSSNNRKIEKGLAALPDERKLLIRYEDLVTKLEETSKVMCDFLGLEYDARMTTYYEMDSKEPLDFLQWKRKILQKPDLSSLGRYKKDLSTEEIQTFDEYAGILLSKYGY